MDFVANAESFENRKVIIFGAGVGGSRALEHLLNNRNSVIGFCDSDPSKWGTRKAGYHVYRPVDIIPMEYDMVVIASIYGRDVLRTILGLGIGIERIADLPREIIDPVSSRSANGVVSVASQILDYADRADCFGNYSLSISLYERLRMYGGEWERKALDLLYGMHSELGNEVEARCYASQACVNGFGSSAWFDLLVAPVSGNQRTAVFSCDPVDFEGAQFPKFDGCLRVLGVDRPDRVKASVNVDLVLAQENQQLKSSVDVLDIWSSGESRGTRVVVLTERLDSVLAFWPETFRSPFYVRGSLVGSGLAYLMTIGFRKVFLFGDRAIEEYRLGLDWNKRVRNRRIEDWNREGAAMGRALRGVASIGGELVEARDPMLCSESYSRYRSSNGANRSVVVRVDQDGCQGNRLEIVKHYFGPSAKVIVGQNDGLRPDYRVRWADKPKRGISTDVELDRVVTFEPGLIGSRGLPDRDDHLLSARVEKEGEVPWHRVFADACMKCPSARVSEVAEFLHLKGIYNLSRYNDYLQLRPGWCRKDRVEVLVLLDRRVSENFEKESKVFQDVRRVYSGCTIGVRLHPLMASRERKGVVNLASEIGIEVLDALWNPLAMIHMADVCVVGGSSIGLDAVLLGKEVWFWGDSVFTSLWDSEKYGYKVAGLQERILDFAYFAYFYNVRWFDAQTGALCQPLDSLKSIVRTMFETPHTKVLSASDLPRYIQHADDLLTMNASYGSKPFSVEEIRARIEGYLKGYRDFRKLAEFSGKRIVLVGPANTLLGQSLGSDIDAFDKVVRLNTTILSYPFSNPFIIDYGSRLDALYLGGGSANDVLVGSDPDQACGIASLEPSQKVYVLDLVTDMLHRRERARTLETTLERLNMLCKGRVVVSSVIPSDVCRWLGGYVPRTGLAAIVDILMHDPACLWVCGFTFYKGGGHLARGNETISLLKGIGNHKGEIDLHNSERELTILGHIKAIFGDRLVLDKALEELLLRHSLDGGEPT